MEIKRYNRHNTSTIFDTRDYVLYSDYTTLQTAHEEEIAEIDNSLVPILRGAGFEKCEFPPDEDTCESCKAPMKQLYFDGPADAGRYYCLSCVINEFIANKECDAQIEKDRAEQVEQEAKELRQKYSDRVLQCSQLEQSLAVANERLERVKEVLNLEAYKDPDGNKWVLYDLIAEAITREKEEGDE